MEKILNANKYYDILKDLKSKGFKIAIVNNKPCNCHDTECCKCDLWRVSKLCSDIFLEWLLSEYKKKAYYYK